MFRKLIDILERKRYVKNIFYHYGVRSYHDWIEIKHIMGRADVSWGRDINEFVHRDRNEVFDNELSQRFGKKLTTMK